MNSNPHNPNPSDCGEETLRLVASLPAPAGLEDRVHTALRNAPRSARVLAWPKAIRPQSAWMRTAAAATIVFAVVGGGWGVLTRVQQNQPAKVIVMPPRVGAPGGFSGAAAMRTPQTLNGPTVSPAVAQPVPVQPASRQPAAKSGQSKPAKKDAASATNAASAAGLRK